MSLLSSFNFQSCVDMRPFQIIIYSRIVCHPIINMCSRGVHQLKKVSLFFCDWGGSSQGVRNLLRSPILQKFAKENPHLEFEYIRKRNAHPYMSSVYINGYIKDVPLRKMSEKQIMEQLTLCNNSFGRRALSASGKRVVGAKQSIQGKWYPNMWANFPIAQMERVHNIEAPDIPMIQKKLRDPRPKKDLDIVSFFRKGKETGGGHPTIP